MKFTMLKQLSVLSLIWLLFGFYGINNTVVSMTKNVLSPSTELKLFYDTSEPAIAFAAEDLKKILESNNISVTLKGLSQFAKDKKGIRIIIAKNNPEILAALKKAKGIAINAENEQEYSLRVTGSDAGKTYWAIGGDRIGAMYGGIHLGEIVKAFGLDSFKNEDHKPYIARRGIKFNIPLDERTPSHDDRGTSAQTNIENMWDLTFWAEYLDLLARQRYNVLSLWNQHPFPSMIKLDAYPDVALNDVYNKAGKVKDMTIDEKIAMWKKVMDYAYDRGIELNIITWNIHMNGALGKYGITEDKTNEISKDYLRKSVEKLFLTYPKLAGIGTTAGENMGGHFTGMTSQEREEWLWDTYGKGIQDVQAIQTDRHIRFIHRYWRTAFDEIDSRFSQLKDGFDMSFKYARGRTYADFAPQFAERELLPILPEGMSTWWNIRNDDIYNLRWGDPEFVRQFILHLPKGDKTAGYYKGSDRFVWGRESISKNPTSPRELENEKHWYSFLLWGRMGYDPETSTDLLHGLLSNRFPGVSSKNLYTAWQSASKIIPLVNKFHWFSWDYLWWPEAGISTGYGVAIPGYHNVNHFIDAPVMPFTDLITIPGYVETVLKNNPIKGTTPMQVADSLEIFAKTALILANDLADKDKIELVETIGDIRAMGYLGNYYGTKIRGAVYLKLYRETKDEKFKTQAVKELENSLLNWQQYAKILDAQYIKMNISMMGIFDWDKLEDDVKNDIEIARNAK